MPGHAEHIILGGLPKEGMSIGNQEGGNRGTAGMLPIRAWDAFGPHRPE